MTPEYTINDRLLAIVQRLCATRDWRLLAFPELGVSSEEFIARVGDQLRRWQEEEGHAAFSDSLVERAIIHEYCVLLCQAVRMEDTAAQERALIEVWNYVTPIIRRKLGAGDRALDCANETLRIVWQQRKDVRTPGAFLSWAAMIATHEVQATFKEADRELALIDLTNGDDTEETDEAISVCIGQEIAIQPPEPDDQAWWENIIRQCLSRMRAGADVFIGLVLQEQSVAEVATRLGLSPDNIHLIKFRAAKRLKRCVLLLQALGRTPDLSSGAS